MKEITVDLTRCPGVAVCAARTCETLLGTTFTREILKYGNGLISRPQYEANREMLTKIIYQCPARAVALRSYRGAILRDCGRRREMHLPETL